MLGKPVQTENAVINILLAEDSENDAIFFRHALRQSQLNARLAHARCAKEAIAYLQGKPPFEDRSCHPFPDMIVTDLNMPEGDGFKLLHWLKHHPQCAVTPTIMLSSSATDADVFKAYQLGANAFMEKPGNLSDLARLLRTTYLFWSQCRRPCHAAGLKCS